MWYDDEKTMSYDELVYENFLLRKELEELRKKHSDFVNEMVNGTSAVTNEWVKLLVSGDLKFK